MSHEKIMSEAEIIFLALADKTRLRLLNLLRYGEVCVGDLCDVTKISQPNVSRHLAYLKTAGVIASRREGKRIHYYLENPTNHFAENILRNTMQWLQSQDDLKADYEKLIDISQSKESAPHLRIDLGADVFAKENISLKKIKELEVFLL